MFCIIKLVSYKLNSGFVFQFTDGVLNWSGREVQGASKVQPQAAHVDQLTQSPLLLSLTMFCFLRLKMLSALW